MWVCMGLYGLMWGCMGISWAVGLYGAGVYVWGYMGLYGFVWGCVHGEQSGTGLYLWGNVGLCARGAV